QQPTPSLFAGVRHPGGVRTVPITVNPLSTFLGEVHPPLGTGRASFPASGSSIGLRPCEARTGATPPSVATPYGTRPPHWRSACAIPSRCHHPPCAANARWARGGRPG